MYGSCATQLDLPSSDLDLVVCGLDDVDHMIPAFPLAHQYSHNSMSNGCIVHEESSNECVPMPLVIHDGQSPTSPTGHVRQLDSTSSSAGYLMHKVRSGEQSSPDILASVVGDQTGLMLDECVDDFTTVGVEHSPGPVSVDDYSFDYESIKQAEVAASERNYSSGFSEHSRRNIATENYPHGFAGEDVSHMEGYAHEYQTNGQEFYYPSPYSFVSSLSINAQRVLRLASELELQPWAVQVKAIPTATVPVVKILVDPAKLPGLVGTGGNWIMQQHIVAQTGATTAATAGMSPAPMSPEQTLSPNQQGLAVSSSSHFFSPNPMKTQWRGADIMNGLQPVDITFEGPEHGGIGSTTYSARVVQDACDETGLTPENTPVVQVASVLKELLAQRRLNEPFSGGLSSYGLLLLLLAVLKDRKNIQEEMKKMERQRQKVRNDESRPPLTQRKCSHGSQKRSVSTIAPLSMDQVNSTVPSSSSSPDIASSDKSSAALSSKSKPYTSSSWASIAKKSNGSTARTDSLSTTTKSTAGSVSIRTMATKVGDLNIIDHRQQENSDVCQDKSGKILSRKQFHGNGSKKVDSYAPKSLAAVVEKKKILPQGNSSCGIDGPSVVISQVTSSSEDDSSKILRSTTGPQGSNDVLEVLCSGS